MSVSGFSIAHDAEVQQYQRMRAAFVAEQKRKEREATEEKRRQREYDSAARGKSEGKIRAGGVLRRLVGLERNLKAGKNLKAEQGGEEEGWSDAETEVDLIDVLKEGKGVEGRDGRDGRREKAPPYVFLQAMAGVTDPLRRRG